MIIFLYTSLSVEKVVVVRAFVVGITIKVPLEGVPETVIGRSVCGLEIMDLHLHLLFKQPTCSSKINYQRCTCIPESSHHFLEMRN